MTLIFVFGSNTAGRHGRGAAYTARIHHGAINGIGEGIQGRSYGIPTKDHHLKTLTLNVIRLYVDNFIIYSNIHQELGFKVTRVGCGYAGYGDMDMAPMFEEANPNNVFFDSKWKKYLGDKYEYWGSY